MTHFPSFGGSSESLTDAHSLEQRHAGELSHLMLNNSLDPDTILQINGKNTMANREVERDKFILLLNEK